MRRLIVLRHGQSIWNLENRFTGWTDVDLSAQGIAEAHGAGALLRQRGFAVDLAFTSVLKRAIRTLWLVLDELDRMWIPVVNAWQLNERHYGALQGLNKAQIAEKYGSEQIHLWRRSYATCPPALDKNDPRHPAFDPRYAGLDPLLLAGTESLKMTLERVVPYWEERIVTHLTQEGKTVLIAAHGNSLRALIKHLEHISDDAIPSLEIPTGAPLVYEFNAQLKVISHYYLEAV
jgi:phosphoglycerate mutase, BPG-dependent, family 1